MSAAETMFRTLRPVPYFHIPKNRREHFRQPVLRGISRRTEGEKFCIIVQIQDAGVHKSSPRSIQKYSVDRKVSGGVQKLYFCMGQPGDAAVQKYSFRTPGQP
jgi:hypothetical protein